MDTETIRAIGSLWLLGLVVFLTVFVVLFRQPLKGIIERLTNIRYRRGDSETEIVLAPEEQVSESEELHGGVVADEEINAAPEADNVPQSQSEWFISMVRASRAGELGPLAEAFNGWQQSEDDAVQKRRNEVLYQYLRYLAGDTEALVKLHELAESPDLSARAQYWIGVCYERSNDFDRAAAAYERSAESAEDEAERVEGLVEAASCVFRAGDQNGAYDGLMHELGTAKEPQSVSKFYEGLASLYDMAKDQLSRTFALEMALVERPNDTGLLFSVAYSYSQLGFYPLALLHYKALLNFKPDYAAALNNMGVAYGNLQLPMQSVKAQRQAADDEEYTLAAANLAYKLMSAGFKKEASDLLEKAKQQPDLHPSVGSAIAKLSETEESESEMEERFINSARERQSFLRRFAEAYFVARPGPADFTARWDTDDGMEVEITLAENTIIGFRLDSHEEYSQELSKTGV